MKLFTVLAVLLFGSVFAWAQGELAPVVEKEIKYKDWTYKSVRDDSTVNLREFANKKKLVMVVYFAPWCPNWKNEAPVAQRLYDKYKANGFDVIAVGEYDSVQAMKTNLEQFKITFPAVYESDSRQAKQTTAHYEYRKSVGDTRGWGSPWNIFLEPAKMPKTGDVLTEKAFLVNGELIEADAEKFIREKLGLTADEKKADKRTSQTIEKCEPEKKIAEFVKP